MRDEKLRLRVPAELKRKLKAMAQAEKDQDPDSKVTLTDVYDYTAFQDVRTVATFEFGLLSRNAPTPREGDKITVRGTDYKVLSVGEPRFNFNPRGWFSSPPYLVDVKAEQVANSVGQKCSSQTSG